LKDRQSIATFKSSPTTQLLFADNSAKYWDISMAVLEQNQLTNNLLNSIPDLLQREYANIVKLLEKSYSEDCEKAAIAEETSEIKVIAERAKEFADNRQFYKFHNALGHALEKIEIFNSSRPEDGYYLPSSIGNLLRESISLHTKNLKVILASSKALLNIANYSENSGKKELLKWAEALENLGDAIEDNIEFFSVDFLEQIQALSLDLIQTSRKKQSNSQTRTNVKDSCRIRIRNAAGFISRLIDSVVEESDAEDREILAAISTANHPVFFED
jgi:hypothetical protein